MSSLGSVVSNGFQSAISYITSLPGQALQWGRDIVDGIARGIRNAIGKITSAVKSVANKIRSFLHFSVPDEGPLTDYETWMPDFIDGLAKGIEKSRGTIQKAVKHLSGDMVITPQYNGKDGGNTEVNFYGNYGFNNQGDIDYFMNQAAIKIARAR